VCCVCIDMCIRMLVHSHAISQFRMFVQAGMSYINDPAHIVFTSNQGEVVKLVESGKVDVGFVRTNQVECACVRACVRACLCVKILKPYTPRAHEGAGECASC